MRIILDECLPRHLITNFQGFDITTVPEAGFAGYKNGQPLKAIEDEYDVFITVDNNLEYQQHLKDYNIAVIILHTKSNRYNDLVPLVSDIIATLDSITSDSLVIIS